MPSKELADRIRDTDFSDHGATVVGYGNMGQQYVRALRALGVGRIRVCTRTDRGYPELDSADEVDFNVGGFERVRDVRASGELGIIATPIEFLAAAAEHLANIGFRSLLIEKPVSLWSERIKTLRKSLDSAGVCALAAYNRCSYPSFVETFDRCREEGGITSCAYALTEMVKGDWFDRFSRDELERWGVANSLHVIGMAHGLIGLPVRWQAFRAGRLPWHPTGAIFVGAGVSEKGIPFSCHADWRSRSRWGIEVHTREASYRLCPIERVFRKTVATRDWEEVPVSVATPDIKAGVTEQVAAFFDEGIRELVSPPTLEAAISLTEFAEDLFGYSGSNTASP